MSNIPDELDDHQIGLSQVKLYNCNEINLLHLLNQLSEVNGRHGYNFNYNHVIFDYW